MSVPIVYNFFIRPDISKKVFKEIRDYKPNILYLVSDGPRTTEESLLVNFNRDQIESMINWDCDVRKLYYEHNQGMDSIMISTYEFVFKSEESLIFLEEDILPGPSFFKFCEEMLYKFKSDNSVYIIGGMNFLGEYPTTPNSPSYFYTNIVSTWGYAIWKRTYKRIQYDLSFLHNEYYRSTVRALMLKRDRKRHYQHLMLKFTAPQKIDFDGEFTLRGLNENVLYNSLAITPSKNLVSNIGDSEGAENGDDLKLYPKAMRRIAEMKVYEMEFPLIHPKFRIVDYHYKSLLRQQGNGLIRKVLIKIERAIRIIVFGGRVKFFKKIRRYFKRLIKYNIPKSKFKGLL